jgi:hypothetical protein
MRFEYFGNPLSPTKPQPAIGTANCLYDAAGNFVPLPTLAADEGSLASLPAATLTDGPWCGAGTNAFDADLLRIKKIRATFRMQAADETLRGTDPRFFMNPGKSQGGGKLVPDYFVRFEVSPRNLNLDR